MKNIISRTFRFYYDGFRSMTIGRTLWAIILIKLFVMFAILRLFFFPNFLNEKAKTDAEKQKYVSEELTNRKPSF